MPAIDMVRSFIDYHIAMTRRVWDSIDTISEVQFLADDHYSHGSIRDVMVHLANTDLNWLTGLRNLPNRRDQFKGYERYPDRATARAFSEKVATQVSEYLKDISEEGSSDHPKEAPGPRREVLLHLVNHGTHHRSTVPQKLHEFGAPTFDQDYISRLANR